MNRWRPRQKSYSKWMLLAVQYDRVEMMASVGSAGRCEGWLMVSSELGPGPLWRLLA